MYKKTFRLKLVFAKTWLAYPKTLRRNMTTRQLSLFLLPCLGDEASLSVFTISKTTI